jgi:AcrR family transcriptional regulator
VAPKSRSKTATAPAPTNGAGRPKREAELLKVAAEVFWAKGYQGATVQDIADAMGVLKGSLYYYIESKEDLLFRIFDASHADALGIVEAVQADDVPPIERLRVFLHDFIVFYLENLERVNLYFRDWRFLTDDRLRVVVEQRKVYEDTLRKLLRSAQEAGEISPDVDVRYAMFFIFGAINGIPDWYQRSGREKPERIAAIYAKLSLEAVSAAV